MTKKDYELIAKGINLARKDNIDNFVSVVNEDYINEIVDQVVSRIASELKFDNIRFDWIKFHEACR